MSSSWDQYFLGARQADALAMIDVQRDVEFAIPDGHPLRLDVYRPPYPTQREPQTGGSARPLAPAVIVIHGGSRSGGEKSDFATYDRWLAASGRVVFDVEYRLANNTQQFPAQLTDIKCAIAWVKSHAAQYHVDPERLALLGRSAGGQRRCSLPTPRMFQFSNLIHAMLKIRACAPSSPSTAQPIWPGTTRIRVARM